MSYRTPAEVVALAAQVLAVAAPDIAPPRPVRQSGYPPRIVADQPGRALPGTLAELAREEVAAVAPGRVAVLGPAVMLPELTRALDEAGLDPIDPRDPSGDGLAAGPGRAAGRRDQRSRVRLGDRRGAVAGRRGGRRAGRRGAAGGHDTGLADPLRRLHETDQAADRPARGAAPRRPALTWAFGPPARGRDRPTCLVGVFAHRVD